MPEQDPVSSLSSSWRAVAWVGAPVAAMFFLMWFITSTVTARLDALEVNSRLAAAAMKTIEDQQWQVVSVLSRICINTSKTDQDRIACVTLSKK